MQIQEYFQKREPFREKREKTVPTHGSVMQPFTAAAYSTVTHYHNGTETVRWLPFFSESEVGQDVKSKR